MNLLACTVKVINYTYMSVVEKDMVFIASYTDACVYHCIRHYVVYNHDHQHGFSFLLMQVSYNLLYICMHVYS